MKNKHFHRPPAPRRPQAQVVEQRLESMLLLLNEMSIKAAIHGYREHGPGVVLIQPATLANPTFHIEYLAGSKLIDPTVKHGFSRETLERIKMLVATYNFSTEMVLVMDGKATVMPLQHGAALNLIPL